LNDADLIVLDRVGKRFDHDRNKKESLRQWFIRTTSRRPRELQAGEFTIADVSVRVGRAEAVAVVGDNGAGKSTLLRLMAGIYEPSTGRVSSSGRAASVLELGAGFHKELTGEDNLAMYAAALGLSRIEFEDRVEAMVSFADIGDVLHKPIKHYSTGMQARLSMAVALCGIFDVILLDEALAVGDRSFRVKVEERVARYIADGGSVVLASHNLDFLHRVCTRALWLSHGRIRADGPVDAVVSEYRSAKMGG
jgi:ABC-type polysaccharide/polyol phosphate transport system ATPase subunit